jgi:hypothetical protein
MRAQATSTTAAFDLASFNVLMQTTVKRAFNSQAGYNVQCSGKGGKALLVVKLGNRESNQLKIGSSNQGA